jgi:hypothetical protein
MVFCIRILTEQIDYMVTIGGDGTVIYATNLFEVWMPINKILEIYYDAKLMIFKAVCGPSDSVKLTVWNLCYMHYTILQAPFTSNVANSRARLYLKEFFLWTP